jgi:hypothetical protein
MLCNERTIKRDVADYISRGLFVAEYDWKRPGGSKFITLRTLQPALPLALPKGIALLEPFPIQQALAEDSASVYWFPLCRRVNLIRKAASELLSRQYEDGRRYLTRHVREVRKELRASSLRRTDIDIEVRDYERAVRLNASLPGLRGFHRNE